MAKGDDIQERLIQFAARIIKVSYALPKTPAGEHVAGQLLRLDECDQLQRILSSSIKTARQPMKT